MRWSWKRPSIPENYRPWLTENQWWINFLALALAVYALVTLFQKGNWAPWMGFSGKTVWDWLSLLGVPLTLAILGYILQQQERNRAEILKEQERERAEKLSREQREIAANEAKEEILQVYFDRLSTLLVDKNILAIAAKVHSPQEKQGDDQPTITITSEERELLDSAVDVIRARTLSILRRFEGDADGKTSVIRFLLESEVIGKAKLNLNGADLREIDLAHAELFLAKLAGANLFQADLFQANLFRAELIGANLTGADLRYANLTEACLILANLAGADLHNANLRGAALGDANLIGADLTGANLTGAVRYMGGTRESQDLTDEQLISAKLCRTTLPDGITLDPNRDCEALGIDPETGDYIGP